MLGNDQFLYVQCRLTRTVTKRQRLPVLVDQQQDAAEFSDPYFETLVEELIGLDTSIGTGKPDTATGLKAEEPEEETQPLEGQTEVGRRDYKVRQFLFSLAPSLVILTYA
jgi:hypothetical protein